MRTISSFKVVALLAPPTNGVAPVVGSKAPFGLGKKPVPSNAVEFGLIMQAGITLPGNCAPCVMPAGAAPPGQLANKTEGTTLAPLGTMIGGVPKLKSPP